MDKVGRRKAIWKKTNGVCAHCGKRTGATKQTIDHFIPKSWGGTYDRRNLLPLCQSCNWERKNEFVNPWKYYTFAPKQEILKCLSYRREWELRTCSMYDAMTA